MSKKKNFFYRVNPESVLSELTSINHDEWLQFFLNFFHDLRNDDPDNSKTAIASTIIKESHNFRELRSKAGKASAQQKETYVEHMLKDVQPVAVAVAVAVKEEPKDLIPYSEIIADLNLKGGFKFKTGEATRKQIHARFAEGFSKADFFHVHTVKVAEWKDDPKMCIYLRPETLYGNKFQGYLNQKTVAAAYNYKDDPDALVY